MKTETAYGLFDGEKLSVIDFRVHVFWYKSQADANCPAGHTVRKVKIEPVTQTKGNTP
jgi:hypothetical protein